MHTGPRVKIVVGVMTFERLGPTGLDYYPCRYGDSRVLFRGPRADLSAPHVLFLGGTATYGKFIPRPFPAMVGSRLRVASVNLGAVNAGPDLYLNDPDLLQITRGAAATVIQVLGAPNLSNRYYSVHPRRNDRFLQASPLLRTVFRDVDFTQFHFTRHMLQTLQALSPERFGILREELREAWVARMQRLVSEVASPVVLLWFAGRPIPAATDAATPLSAQDDPLFIDRSMIDRLGGKVAEVVKVVASPAALAQGTEGMVFSEMEATAAQAQLGIQAHAEAAAALIRVLGPLVPRPHTTVLN